MLCCVVMSCQSDIGVDKKPTHKFELIKQKMAKNDSAAEATQTNEEAKQNVESDDQFDISKLDEMVVMEDGTSLPRYMVGYTIPVDAEGKLKKPYRKYMSDTKCWNAHFPTEPGDEYKTALLRDHWIAKYPNKNPDDFDETKLSSEDANAHHSDERWSKIRKEFLYEHALGAKRIQYFKEHFNDDFVRCEAEKKAKSATKAAKLELEKLDVDFKNGKKGGKKGKKRSARSDSEEDETPSAKAVQPASAESGDYANFLARNKRVNEFAKRARANTEQLIEDAQNTFL